MENTVSPLKIFDRSLSPGEIFSLLERHRLLLPLVRETILDEIVSEYPCPLEEQVIAFQQMRQATGLDSEEIYHDWLARQDLTARAFYEMAIRAWQIERFKSQHWENQLESYYLERKRQIDRVVYSLVRVRNPGMATEIYFRIEEGEASFEEIAEFYSEGEEKYTRGMIGPIEIGQVHPEIALRLQTGQPGKIHYPIEFGEWSVLLRLDHWLPTPFDETTRQRLLDELFQEWLSERALERIRGTGTLG